MNPNWLGIVSAGIGWLAFFAMLRLASKMNQRPRFLLSVLTCILAIPGASFTIYYLHLLPEPAWYYQFRSFVGTEFLIVLLGTAGGMVASLMHRVLMIFPLLGVVVFSIVPFLKPLIGPLQLDYLENRWDREICLQSTPSTCGAASAATLLKFFGEDASEQEVARKAHSYRGGTEAWYLARVVRSRGCQARFRLSTVFDRSIDFPALVGVKLGSIGHFITILKEAENGFVVGDPLRGREILSAAQLLSRYKFTGFYMEMDKSE